MLPNLHTLHVKAAVGHLGHTTPANLTCPQCGQSTGIFEQVEIVLDSRPECDIVAADDAYFITVELLSRLQELNATGYFALPASVTESDDFRRSYPEPTSPLESVPKLYYLAITGKCDGPWVRNIQTGKCTLCGKPRPKLKDFDKLTAQILEELPEQPSLVFPDTWHGEDFFYLSEPGLPLITQRIADLLAETGNLRQEEIANKERIRRLMPKYAAKLERNNWLIDRCVRLGPAGWIDRIGEIV